MRFCKGLCYLNARFNVAHDITFARFCAYFAPQILQEFAIDKHHAYRTKFIYGIRSHNFYTDLSIMPHMPKSINGFYLVPANIDYTHKFCNRSRLQALNTFGAHTDVIIVKNGMITDSSIANLLFWDHKHWYTPSMPLLKGTTRARLLHQGRIIPRCIKPSDLRGFSKIMMINALNDFDKNRAIPIECIANISDFA